MSFSAAAVAGSNHLSAFPIRRSTCLEFFIESGGGRGAGDVAGKIYDDLCRVYATAHGRRRVMNRVIENLKAAGAYSHSTTPRMTCRQSWLAGSLRKYNSKAAAEAPDLRQDSAGLNPLTCQYKASRRFDGLSRGFGLAVSLAVR